MAVTNSFFLVTLIFYFTQWSSAEMYTSMSAIAPLLETHKKMIDTLDAIVLHEEKMLGLLKSQLRSYKVEQIVAMNDTNNYLENPINAFKLIKRLTVDNVLTKYIIKSKADEFMKELTEKYSDLIYPGLEDLEGAAKALVRLKDTYQLSVNDLSKGVINGVSYGLPMKSSDCFELGRVLFRLGKYEDARPWMMEAYYMHDKDDSLLCDKVEIVEHIVYIQYLIGDFEDATEWMGILRNINPESSIRKTENYELRRAIEKQEIKQRSLIENFSKPDDTSSENEEDEYDAVLETFESLCRGETTVPKEISKKLTCNYLTDTHPFLKIAPLKVEQVYLNPEVLIFYDVLMDDEIDDIIDIAKPNMKRASVSDSYYVTENRISKVAWIHKETEVVTRVSQRVNQMTGLNMETAEMLQVINYGIGGHYRPHLDANLDAGESPDFEYPGNRLATILFYLSDVAEGGSTVFTNLGFGVSPTKGMAVLWYNLDHSGRADIASEHGSCPVLLGSKWVSTCQLHEAGQEFARPCNLEY